AGIANAHIVFNVVFFVSLTSVLIQGTTLSVVTRWLHVAVSMRVKPKSAVDAFLSDSTKSLIKEIVIPHDSYSVGKRIVELGFPRKAIIAMISRDGQFLTPNGSTILEPEDTLIILLEDKDSLQAVFDSLYIDPHSV